MTLLKKYWLPTLLIVAAFVFPFVDDALETDLIFPMIIVAIYILLALGLNIVVGFAGLLDLGFVAFYALGAYVVGWFASTQFRQVSFSFGSTAASITGGQPQGIHISFWILLVLAGAFAALCGVIIGAPTLRLRGDYLAIVTLGFGEIIPKFFQNGDNLGGFNLSNGTIGIKAIDSPGLQFLPDTFDAWQRFGTLYLHPWYYTILVLVLITIYVNIRLRDSRLGRAWISVREDETAAAAMGINPVTTKLWAYALGAVFGGFAGAFYGAFIKNIFRRLLVQRLDPRAVHGHPRRHGEHLRRDPGRDRPAGPQLLPAAADKRLGPRNRQRRREPCSEPGGHPEV